ncbi:DMT family transporter [Nocardia sp. NPDC047038]|uniref:DMT family transporter n=1 Tax=Nocardia sp. NPDC047038 TaxID=3154338 RepID=UPI0033D1EFC9
MGLFEGVNISLYAAALAIGPAPVVVALHLTSPIMLLLLAMRTGKRPVSVGIVVELLLLGVAITLVAGQPGADLGSGKAVGGCALALGSAAAVTALIVLVTSASRQRDPTMSAGLQLAVAGVLTTPLLLSTNWNGGRVLTELVLGAALLGPGFALYWRAVRHLRPATVGAVGLTEAVVASALVGVVDRSQISMPIVLSGVLVATAVLLDIRDRSR